MDGVPGVSQPEIQPGGTFTYDFVVPDAGLFWYHPHVMAAMQVGFGLYGALLVDAPTDRVGVSDELVLVLSDIGIDDDGTLLPANAGGSGGMAFGREGSHVNSGHSPIPRHGRTRFTFTASSFRCWERTAPRRGRWRGKTLSTYRSVRQCASSFTLTIVPEPGWFIATFSIMLKGA